MMIRKLFCSTKYVLVSVLVLLGVHSNSMAQVYQDLSVNQCDSLINANVDNPNFVILDVRTPGEYVPQHLEGAINRNFYDGDFEAQLDVMNKDKMYLIHCASGGRSGVTLGTMEQLNFAEVYNMLGGINQWNSQGLPTTTEFAPRLMFVSESVFPNKTIEIGQVDTIAVTLTNRGNSILSFNSITDLTGTEFSSDFNMDATLQGAADYSFSVYYTPTDESPDVMDFFIESNAGTVQLSIERTGMMTVNTHELDVLSHIQLFPNPASATVYIKGFEGDKVSLEIINMAGQVVITKEVNAFDGVINVSGLDAGVYFVNLQTQSKKGTAVLVIE